MINLPDITPFPTGDVNIEHLVEQIKILKEAIKEKLQNLEDNKQTSDDVDTAVDSVVGAINHDDLDGFVANEHLPGIDEDDMASDSVAHVPTQQSVKAYVDGATVDMTTIVCNDGDVITDNGEVVWAS